MVLALAAMTGTLAPSLSAQRVMSSVDVSGTGVWYADSIRSTGTSLAPAIRLDWPSATISASFSVSRLGGGGSSLQGALAPSVFTPSIGPLSAELAGSFGGSSHHDGTKTGAAMGITRAYASFARTGAFAGFGLGGTWDGALWRRVRQAEAGVWLERNALTALATASPVVVEDTLRYTDTQLALRYPTSAFEVGLTAGLRSGMVGAEIGGTSRTWGSLTGMVWVSPRMAIVANAGTYPIDFTQGYPGGRFISLSLRIASRGTRPLPRGEVAAQSLGERVAHAATPAGVTEFLIRKDAGSSRTIRVQARAASSVEINGDFTRWQPARLMRGVDGWWSVSLPVAPGTYQVNIRVNGGAWLAPPGLLTTTDEFGGVVGILVVE